jgi:hypothetical protein
LRSCGLADTSKFSFSFLKDKDPLLLETSLFTKSGIHKREKQYDLIIGNIEIKRGFGIDSIQVFQNGVLQNYIAMNRFFNSR